MVIDLSGFEVELAKLIHRYGIDTAYKLDAHTLSAHLITGLRLSVDEGYRKKMEDKVDSVK